MVQASPPQEATVQVIFLFMTNSLITRCRIADKFSPETARMDSGVMVFFGFVKKDRLNDLFAVLYVPDTFLCALWGIHAHDVAL